MLRDRRALVNTVARTVAPRTRSHPHTSLSSAGHRLGCQALRATRAPAGFRSSSEPGRPASAPLAARSRGNPARELASRRGYDAARPPHSTASIQQQRRSPCGCRYANGDVGEIVGRLAECAACDIWRWSGRYRRDGNHEHGEFGVDREFLGSAVERVQQRYGCVGSGAVRDRGAGRARAAYSGRRSGLSDARSGERGSCGA